MTAQTRPRAQDLKAPARFFKLKAGGEGLRELARKLAELQRLNQLSSLYAMLNGLNIISLLARWCACEGRWPVLVVWRYGGGAFIRALESSALTPLPHPTAAASACATSRSGWES